MGLLPLSRRSRQPTVLSQIQCGKKRMIVTRNIRQLKVENLEVTRQQDSTTKTIGVSARMPSPRPMPSKELSGTQLESKIRAKS